MKKVIGLSLIVGLSSISFSQIQETCLNQQPASHFAPQRGVRTISTLSSRSGRFAPMAAYGNFSFGDRTFAGPAVTLQFSPRRTSALGFDFSGGFIMSFGSSRVSQEDLYPRVGSTFSRFGSSIGRNHFGGFFLQSTFGFIGADFTYYLAEGAIRPYVGGGAYVVGAGYSGDFYTAIAPDAKAGLQVEIRNSVSGFAEVRRFFGMPNTIGPGGARFNGSTMAAVGVSFAPRLR